MKAGPITWLAHSSGLGEWSNAVILAMQEVADVQARSVRAIQVSSQWHQDHDRPAYVWGVPIEVDPLLFGDGFRLVVG